MAETSPYLGVLMHDRSNERGGADGWMACSLLMVLVHRILRYTFMPLIFSYPERATSHITESQTSLNYHGNYTVKISHG